MILMETTTFVSIIIGVLSLGIIIGATIGYFTGSKDQRDSVKNLNELLNNLK